MKKRILLLDFFIGIGLTMESQGCELRPYSRRVIEKSVLSKCFQVCEK